MSNLSIEAYHQALRNGHITCRQATENCLARIREQSHLNAFIEVWEEEALQRADAIDQKIKNGIPTGKLAGVITGIKDVLCYRNHSVSAGSRMLQSFTSLFTATAVERLLQEDAILIGRQNCDEFAMGSSNENSFYGPVLNAADNTRVPGGSSGGSAVAVQSGMCMISLGTDTGGSVRQPADFCGIVGLKPGYGRISRHGLIAYASSFDQIGIFAHHVSDAALVLETIAGPDEYDSTVSTQPAASYSRHLQAPASPIRFAYFPEMLDTPALDPEIKSAIYQEIEKIKSCGNQAEPVSFDLLEYIIPAYYVMTTAEASSNLSRYDGVKYGHRSSESVRDLTDFYKKNRSEGFGAEVKKRILLGTFVLSAGYYDAYFTRAQKVRRLLVEKTAEVFSKYDALLLPTSPTTAWKLGEKSNDPLAMYLADIYTVYANLVGAPAISIPLFGHSNGLPFGLQVMTAQFREQQLLQIASYLMQQKKSSKAS